MTQTNDGGATDLTTDALKRLADECRDMGNAAHAQAGASKYMRTLWKAESTLRELIERREADSWSPETNIMPWCALTIGQMREFEASTGEIQRMGLNGEWIATDTPLSPGLIYRIIPTTEGDRHERK